MSRTWMTGRRRYKRFLLMLVMMAQFPVITHAEDSLVCSHSVCIGDSIETLVRSAGRPHHVERKLECLGSPCKQMGFLEQWTYLRENSRFTVELFNDRVTSILRETAL
ncbi:hypothetical protein GCM10011348_39980 [Marinobacterium nitratireducens]|uniref:DUF2845 domain-containing protein n=1 Tax=Marinobacterium nitratireducens TaxID=518897 RepID=A0A917ZNG5_9GAMM|nr:hypothetical protein [Marinobacterium nitratireducens]GGO87244.1 hypothetical protein GCM10011348_39980 [Marinobacterium nitratireducens]